MIPLIVTTPLPPRGPHGRPIRQLVVHCMGEYINGVSAHDALAALNVSAHALILPNGTIQHCVPRDQRAYHVADMNSGRLGVELLVSGDHNLKSLAAAIGWDRDAWQPMVALPADPYTDAQYTSLAWWLAQEARLADLGWAAVTTHHALQPERKFDPGPVLDWVRLERLFLIERELAA